MSVDVLGTTSARPTVSVLLIAAIFCVGGIMHFVAPRAYARIVPPWLPAPMLLVLVSGVAELLGGVGVLIPATRIAAGWGLIALLVVLFPANVFMLQAAHAAGASRLRQAVLVARLPMQPALMLWILRAVIRDPS